MLSNYTVPDKELRVTMTMTIEAEDLGAQSSSTDTAHKGIKPKRFNISLIIPFIEQGLLTELTAIAESTQDDGSLTVYDITDRTANAVGVRQVIFCDSLGAREAQSLKAWNVTFSLMEYQSIAEKVEQRREAGEPVEQVADGVAVSVEEEIDQEQPMTSAERFLFRIDRALS